MPIEVELPDGAIAEFPDDMQPGQIESVLKQRFAPDPLSFPSAQLTPQFDQPTTLGRANEAAMEWKSSGEILPTSPSRAPNPLPDPYQEQAPPGAVSRFTGEIFTSPVGFGKFQNQNGKTVAPGFEFTPAGDVDAPNRGATVPTPFSAAISALPEGKLKQVGAGLYNAQVSLVNFFLSPAGIASFGIGALPAEARQALSAGFAADMARQAPEALRAGDEAFQRGDLTGAVEHWLGGAQAIGFAGAAGKHAMSRGGTPVPQELETSMRQLERGELAKDKFEPPTIDRGTGQPIQREVGVVSGQNIPAEVPAGRIQMPQVIEATTPQVTPKVDIKPASINPGGAQSALPPEQRAVSEQNNSLKAFAESNGVVYEPADTPQTIYAKIQAKAAPHQVAATSPGEISGRGPATSPDQTATGTAGAKAPDGLPETPAPAAESSGSPELIGMGGATPAELSPPTPFKTSNKNATVDAERKARGLPPMMEAERKSNQSAWDDAMRLIDERPEVQDELIAELATTPRAVTPTENSMLLHRRVDLRNEYEKALRRWREAFESDDFARAAEESQRVKDWSSKLADLEDITKRTGTESGRSLQARKMEAAEDFSLASMELRAMEAKGRNLTNDEHLQLIRAQEKILELENKLADLGAGRSAKEVEASTTETLKEVAATAPKEAKSKDFDVDREESLTSKIKAKIAKGQIAEITPLVQKLARVFWRRGIREREAMTDALHAALKTVIPEITRDETKRAFSGYGQFKPLSKEAIDVGLRDLRGQTQQVLKLEALEAKKPLEKTGQERRAPSDEERRLIKQVNELKRKYGVVVTDPETQLKSALQSRKTYYERRISDLKYEIENRQRTVKTKTESPRDAELDRMIAEYERLKEEHSSIFGERTLTDEQRLKIALAAAERNRAQWEAKLESAEKGIFTKRVEGRKISNAELDLIKAEAAAMRQHVKELEELSKPKKSPEAIALEALKSRMLRNAVDLLTRIEKGDYAKRERKPVVLDEEGNAIKAELDLAKEEFQRGLERDRWAKMSVFDKTKRKIADTYDAARAIMTTGELSFILRQAKFTTLSHPILTAKALPNMFRALLSSEKRAHELDLQVHNHPDAPAARAAKLHLVEEGLSLHKQEELMMGRWVGNIPVVKNFNRAAQVFLNRIRFDTWQAMRKSLSKSGTPTPLEDKQIAMFVNEATGRGGLGSLEAAAVPLARVMFSPRYFASRLQLAAGHSLWGGTMRTRKIIATEYARSLIGLGLYYTLLNAYFSSGDSADKDSGRIETDPRSSDFGKVIIGNTRIDPLAGLSQVITFGARTATGEKKNRAGKVTPIRGDQVPYGGDKWSDVALDFGRGKLHPVPASIANLFDGTDMGGNQATVMNQAANMVAPITYIDIWKALKEQDLDDATAMSLLALLGEGLQTQTKRDEKK
jgi:hypothetical protein